jgi:DNA mismatch repair protein MSH4
VNGLLDVARQNFKEVTSDVFKLLDTYTSTTVFCDRSDIGQYDLPIDLKFDEQRGYYMVTKKSELEKRQLPSVFTNVSAQGVKLIYDSLDLCKKNAKLRHSLNEIYVLSFETIMKLIDDVRVYIGCLYKVCEGIAMLDMVWCSQELY